MEEKRIYYVLIIYDIVSDKNRNKFVKEMEKYGYRVQKSAFEAYINDSQYKELIKRIDRFNKDEDNIRVYKMYVDTEVKKWGKENIGHENEKYVVI